MDWKLQMGSKAEMQMGRAVIRSIWQHHRLKSSVHMAAWSCFLGCADTACCGLHCELCEWSFGLKTVVLGPVLLALWSWPSPIHSSAACRKPSEVYSRQNDCCDYSFAEKHSSEREEQISFYNLFCLLLKTGVLRLLVWLPVGVLTMSAPVCEAHVTQGESRQVGFSTGLVCVFQRFPDRKKSVSEQVWPRDCEQNSFEGQVSHSNEFSGGLTGFFVGEKVRSVVWVM